MEQLILHEEQQEKEYSQCDLHSLENLSQDEEGEIQSEYGGSADEGHENPHGITRELEILIEHHNSL